MAGALKAKVLYYEEGGEKSLKNRAECTSTNFL